MFSSSQVQSPAVLKKSSGTLNIGHDNQTLRDRLYALDVNSYATLKALDVSNHRDYQGFGVAYGNTFNDSAGGRFVWTNTNLFTECAADEFEGIYVKPDGGDGNTGAYVRVLNDQGLWDFAWWRPNATHLIHTDASDDSPRLNSCVGLMPNNGITLAFGARGYFFKTQINLIEKKGVKILGRGNGDGLRTVFLFNNTSQSGLNFRNAKGCEVTGINLRTNSVGGNMLVHGITFGMDESNNASSANRISFCTIQQCLIGVDFNGVYTSYVNNCSIANNLRDIRTTSGTQTVHNMFHHNVMGDHPYDSGPCIKIGGSKNHVVSCSFETNSTVWHRLVDVESGAQDTHIENITVVSNTTAPIPNGGGGIRSLSNSTSCIGVDLKGDLNTPTGEGNFEGGFTRISSCSVSGAVTSLKPGIRLMNTLLRCTISDTRIINTAIGIKYENAQSVSVDNIVFDGVTKCHEGVGVSTTIGQSLYRNCGTFGTFTTLTDCDVVGWKDSLQIPANTTVPNVFGARNIIISNNAQNNLNGFSGMTDGSEIMVRFTNSLCTVNFTNQSLRGNGGANWSPNADDFMTVRRSGSLYYCTVVNT